MENIGTWIGIGGFALTIGGVILKLALSIDRVTQAVKGMASGQSELSKAKEALQTEAVEHRGLLRDHSDTLERHEDALSKHEGKIESAGQQLATLMERTHPAKLA